MKLEFTRYLQAVLLAASLASCSSGDTTPAEKTAHNSTSSADCDALRREAKIHDSILLTRVDFDSLAGEKAIRAFAAFARHCGHDTTAGIYLIKTAQVARSMNRIPQAKAALDRCIDDFRDFSGRPAALILLAQLYEEPNYLNNAYEARRTYQRVIDEYPGTVWASNASAARARVGKSDAEIIRGLNRKAK